MLGILKSKPPFEQEAKALYAQCLQSARNPVFYQDYALSDTFEARFDLLLLHVFLVIERNLSGDAQRASDLNQAIFDVLFADMDQSMREQGIGDMGIPKRMKKLMKGFNGRMHSLSEALEDFDLNADSRQLATAIARNVYATDTVSASAESLAAYVLEQRNHLAHKDTQDMASAHPLFSQPKAAV